jgi:hypothetical protein
MLRSPGKPKVSLSLSLHDADPTNQNKRNGPSRSSRDSCRPVRHILLMFLYFRFTCCVGRPSYEFPDNTITNTKYTWLSFLPLNLREQFRHFTNQYFLFIAILQIWSEITAVRDRVFFLYRHRALSVPVSSNIYILCLFFFFLKES